MCFHHTIELVTLKFINFIKNHHYISKVIFSKSSSVSVFNCTINDISVSRKNKICDLGVIFNFNLNFSEHFQPIYNSAFQSLGMVIKNTLHFPNKRVLICLLSSLVRSEVEWLRIRSHSTSDLTKDEKYNPGN